MKSTMLGDVTLSLVHGDITKCQADVIVNAANSALAGGGGVDGAIHRAGGPQIMADLDEIRAELGGCPTGDAVTTEAGRLPAGWVVHAVGPVWRGGAHGEHALLERTYRRALEEACRVEAESVAFPSISTGAYRFPIERAAPIALGSVARFVMARHPSELRRVTFVLFTRDDLATYASALTSLVRTKLG